MKDIPGYEGKYAITEDGRVWSYVSEIFLSTHMKKGYFMVTLKVNGVGKKYGIHQLVALTYIPNPEGKPTVDHINRIRTDNRISNLRWATRMEQAENRSDPFCGKQSEICNLGARTVAKAVEMRDIQNHSILIKTFSSSMQAAIEQFGDKAKNSRINRCANNKCKSAYGYYWCFVHQ